jgi:hypothetical protein
MGVDEKNLNLANRTRKSTYADLVPKLFQGRGRKIYFIKYLDTLFYI